MPPNRAPQEFAIIGLGHFGISLATQLVHMGHTVLAIDRDPELVQELADDLTQTVALDATDEAALRAVGVQAFETAVVAIGADFESSILITTLLKELGLPRVICKALTERQKAILLKVGADQVVLPEHEAGVQLARRLVVPDLIDALELEPGYGVAQMSVPEGLVGHTLRDLDLTGRFGVIVLAIKGQRLRVAPRADEVLAAGDVLLALGSDDAIEKLETWEP
jgi:trk system potassium uptake protein TrkA